MYSSVALVLRRSFAHESTSRIRSDFSRPCEHFSSDKTTPCVKQCYTYRKSNSNVRTSWSNLGLGLSNNNIVRPSVRPRRSTGSRKTYIRPSSSGIGLHMINYTSCSNVLSMNSKIQFCQPLKEFSSTDISNQTALILQGTIDRFNGVRINMEEQLRRNEISTLTTGVKWNLKDTLLRTLSYYKAENKPAVWLEISAHCGNVIPVAAEVGFSFHHAEKSHVMMYQWLDEGENRIPEYATHQVGVSGFVLDQQRQQVLMVQDKHRIARWKFPGGYSKLGEDFSETAKREVFEETGVRTEFKSILAFRQQHQMPYSFNRSDIYVVCRLEPVTFDLTVCSTELLDAKWIPLKELFTSEVHTGLTLHVAGLAKQGLEKGFQDVDITMSELPSVYKGMTYKLFSRS